jgi:hypothetical protein
MKWENNFLEEESLANLQETCNDQGLFGWELVSVFPNGRVYVACLKRKIPDSTKAINDDPSALTGCFNSRSDRVEELQDDN